MKYMLLALVLHALVAGSDADFLPDSASSPVEGLVLSWDGWACITASKPTLCLVCGSQLQVTPKGCLPTKEGQVWNFKPDGSLWESAAHPGQCIQLMDQQDSSQDRFQLQPCNKALPQQRFRPTADDGTPQTLAADALPASSLLIADDELGREVFSMWTNKWSGVTGHNLFPKGQACGNSCYRQKVTIENANPPDVQDHIPYDCPGCPPVSGLVLSWTDGQCATSFKPYSIWCHSHCNYRQVRPRSCKPTSEVSQTWTYHPDGNLWESMELPGQCMQSIDPESETYAKSVDRFQLRDCDKAVPQQRFRPVDSSDAEEANIDIDDLVNQDNLHGVTLLLKSPDSHYLTKWSNKWNRLSGYTLIADRDQSCRNSCYYQELTVTQIGA